MEFAGKEIAPTAAQNGAALYYRLRSIDEQRIEPNSDEYKATKTEITNIRQTLSHLDSQEDIDVATSFVLTLVEDCESRIPISVHDMRFTEDGGGVAGFVALNIRKQDRDTGMRLLHSLITSPRLELRDGSWKRIESSYDKGELELDYNDYNKLYTARYSGRY